MSQPISAGRILGYRAEQVDRFIRQRFAEDGMAPTYAVIMAEIGIGSEGEVSRIVRSLERRGLLSRNDKGKSPRIGRVANC